MKFLYFFLFPFIVFSQNISKRQRLLQTLDTTSTVSEKAQLFVDLAWEYTITENDSALFYAEKAFLISKEKNYNLGEAKALEAKGLYEEIVTGNYNLASEYYFKGIELREEYNLVYATSIYHSVGVMFHTSDNFEKAKEYYTIAYNRAKAENNILIQKKCLVNLGAVNSSLKDYETAEAMLVECLTLDIRRDFDYSIYANLGNLYIRKKEYNKALPYLLLATEQNPENPGSEENLYFLINVKTALKDSTNMTQILNRATVFIKESVSQRPKSLMLMAISNYHRAFREFEKALVFRDEYLTLYEEIKEGQRDQTVYNLETKYQTEKVQRELDQKKSAQNLLYIILGFAGILLIIISFFFYKNRNKNKQISKALKEKEILLKEIHHRVKNNLQVVSSLLSLQQRQTKDSTAHQALQEGRNRVKAMALIHQNLYQDENLVGVDMQQYITKLVNNLVSTYKTDSKTIHLKTEIEPLKLDVDTIIPLGLIINELISNSLKYAFVNKDSGEIFIGLKIDNGSLQLKVKDNGKGFPQDFSIEKADSLGYKLIRSFSQKLEAELNLKSSEKGTNITLIISNFKIE